MSQKDVESLQNRLYALSVGLDMGADIREHVLNARELSLNVRKKLSKQEKGSSARLIMILVNSSLTFTPIADLTGDRVRVLHQIVEAYARGEMNAVALARALKDIQDSGLVDYSASSQD